ncbi:MAG TPA: MaoC family dehydratase [Candidatus Acidoferrales bacterium]|nr:MaoC family dehydratase [Candidatus Acidoferrales bacterium]
MQQSGGGRFFEDFTVGDVIAHALARTINESDNTLFTMLTMNTNPVHFDAEYAKQTAFGQILVNSCFTFSLAVGLSTGDLSRHVFANLGWNEIVLPAPVFLGDTVRARSEVLSTRDSASRPDVGIVEVQTTGTNQRGEKVISFKRTFMVYRRGHGPQA